MIKWRGYNVRLMRTLSLLQSKVDVNPKNVKFKYTS